MVFVQMLHVRCGCMVAKRTRATMVLPLHRVIRVLIVIDGALVQVVQGRLAAAPLWTVTLMMHMMCMMCQVSWRTRAAMLPVHRVLVMREEVCQRSIKSCRLAVQDFGCPFRAVVPVNRAMGQHRLVMLRVTGMQVGFNRSHVVTSRPIDLRKLLMVDSLA